MNKILLLLLPFLLTACIVTEKEFEQARQITEERLLEIEQTAKQEIEQVSKDMKSSVEAKNTEIDSKIEAQQTQLGLVDGKIETQQTQLGVVDSKIEAQQTQLGLVDGKIKTQQTQVDGDVEKLNAMLSSLSEQLKQNAQLIEKVESDFVARQNELSQKTTTQLQNKLDVDAFDKVSKAQIDDLKKLESDYLANIKLLSASVTTLAEQKASAQGLESLQTLVVTNQKSTQDALVELNHGLKVSAVAEFEKIDEQIKKMANESKQTNADLVENFQKMLDGKVTREEFEQKLNERLANVPNRDEVNNNLVEKEKQLSSHIVGVETKLNNSMVEKEKQLSSHIVGVETKLNNSMVTMEKRLSSNMVGMETHLNAGLAEYGSVNTKILEELNERTNFLLKTKANKDDLKMLNDLLTLDFSRLKRDVDNKVDRLNTTMLELSGSISEINTLSVEANRSQVVNAPTPKAEITFDELNDGLYSIERDLEKLNNEILMRESAVMGGVSAGPTDLEALQTNQEQSQPEPLDKEIILKKEDILNLGIKELLELQKRLSQ